MLISMTGYGRAQATAAGRDITVEVRSVNHRYFECSTRIPRAYGYLEEKLKKLANTVITRGKVEIGATIYNVDVPDAQVGVNAELAAGYVAALRGVKDALSLQDDLSLSSLARLPDVFLVRKAEEDADAMWDAVRPVAEEALSRFVAMRKAEGVRLYEDISGRLPVIAGYVDEVEKLSPQTLADYRARLYNKLKEVLGDRNIDESRILTEAAIFADKIAVDEETVRLRSHLRQFSALLDENRPVGKKLDFLVQEMNREVNTIGSKCQDVRVTRLVVEMKSEIEKIREQIQNVE